MNRLELGTFFTITVILLTTTILTARRGNRWTSKSLGMLGVGSFVLTSGIAYSGSLVQFHHFVNGRHLVVSPMPCDLGAVKGGKVATVRLTLTNVTRRPIKLVGSGTDCSCVVADQIPEIIGPLESAEVTVKVHCPLSEGAFKRKVEFYMSTWANDPPHSLIVGSVVQ